MKQNEGLARRVPDRKRQDGAETEQPAASIKQELAQTEIMSEQQQQQQQLQLQWLKSSSENQFLNDGERRNMQASTVVTPPAAPAEGKSTCDLLSTTAHRTLHNKTAAPVARMVSLDNCVMSPPQLKTPPQQKNEQKPRLVFSPMLNYPYWYPNPPTTSSTMNENTAALDLMPLLEASALVSPSSSHTPDADATPPQQQSMPPQFFSSLLESRISQAHLNRYMVVIMERASLDSPWGLSITLLENRFLMVGHVSTTRTSSAPAPFIRKACACDSFATPTRFWNQHHDLADHMTDVPTFVSNLLREPPVQTHEHVASIHSIVRPGDALLAVAGLTLVQWKFSLADITACLRETTSVSLLIFRHPLAGYAAWQATSSNLGAQRVAEEALCTMRIHMGPLVPVILIENEGTDARQHDKYIASPLAAASGASATTMNTDLSPVLPSPPQKATVSLWSSYMSPKNLLFRNDINPEGIPFCDDLIFECETNDSYRLFLSPIDNFKDWLARRKAKWRQTYSTALQRAVFSECPRNPLFESNQAVGGTIYCDENGNVNIGGGDQYGVSDPDDRIHIFVPAITNFPEWLARRKETWRQTYTVVAIPENLVQEDLKQLGSANTRDVDLDHSNVDFWTLQGFGSHAQWLTTRTAQWKLGYSWNRRKRRRLEHDVQEVVHLEHDNFSDWLRVRKNQWKVQRRKRQRDRLEEMQSIEHNVTQKEGNPSSDNSVPNKKRPPIIWIPSALHPQSGDLIAIDALLEDRRRQQKAIENRLRCHQSSLNISFLFDADHGCPDDTVTRILTFLDPLEHGILLSISRGTRRKLKARENVWRQLCPSHWQLPRRPRKSWHTIYWTHLQAETERYHKNWDELLAKASSVLLQRDELQVIEKIVAEAQRNWNFSVDYVSSVVCERNSLLNLAVIHQRHKVVRWLVEIKGANIESCDRGDFTALLNAAYAGDRYLVRFLMQRGADRTKVGKFHYTKPLSLGMGLTAEGWAEKNGHADVAKLLRFGL